MRKTFLRATLLLLVLGAAGCGDSYPVAMRRVLRDLSDISRALNSARTKETASAAATRIQAARSRLDADVARLSAAEPRGEAEKRRMQEKYGPVLHNLLSNISSKKNTVARMDGGQEAADAVGEMPTQLTALAEAPQ
jgi:hypothetical protein